MLVPYLGEHKYQQVIQEYQAYAQRSGDKNMAEFAAALDSGFRAGGWPAPRKGIEVLLAQRKAKTNYLAPYQIAALYADTGDRTTLRVAQHRLPERASWSSACGLTRA